jgi:hypothetical protein
MESGQVDLLVRQRSKSRISPPLALIEQSTTPRADAIGLMTPLACQRAWS